MKTLIAALFTLGALAAQEMPPIPQPTAEHVWLQQLVGDWTAVSEATMAPGAEPTLMTFEESVHSIGGIWVQSRVTADFGGQSFTAQLLLGYDSAKQAFVGTWFDTVQTHLWVYRGSLDEARKVLTLAAEGPSFGDPTQLAKYHDVIEIHGKDHRTLTSSVLGDDGKWTQFNRSEYRRKSALETATFAGGCFWCVEAIYARLEGVRSVESGYMGGSIDNPTYKQICTGDTGHAEVVQLQFDPEVISYDQLLDYFFALHDPTTLNRQGNDIGTQYRSAVFFHSAAQEKAALAALERARKDHKDPIVTEITAAAKYWPAEGYHQDYWAKNPDDRYCNALIPGKLKKLGLDKDSKKK